MLSSSKKKAESFSNIKTKETKDVKVKGDKLENDKLDSVKVNAEKVDSEKVDLEKVDSEKVYSEKVDSVNLDPRSDLSDEDEMLDVLIETFRKMTGDEDRDLVSKKTIR